MSRKASSAGPSGPAEAGLRRPLTIAARLRRAVVVALPLTLLLALDARPGSTPDPSAPPASRSPSIMTEGEAMGAGEGALPGKYQALAAVAHLSQLLSYLELPSSPTVSIPLAGAAPGPPLPAGTADPISDGQLGWAPQPGTFRTGPCRAKRGSPLAPYAPDLALWASSSSVKPKVLLAALE